MTAANHPNLAALLAAPERTPEVPLEHIPTLLVQLAAEQVRLSSLFHTLTTRLLMEGRRTGITEDHLLTADEAAQRLRTSKDWLRRHSDHLPFVTRISDGQVRYSAKAIDRFISARTGF